jgi:hypothetical protein
MKTYAFIEDGKVSEIIPPYVNPEGVDVPIEDRYTPNMVAQMVDITDLDPQPQQQWTYDGSVFAAPVPPGLDLVLLAANARYQRDFLFSTIADPGTLMAQRAIRLATKQADITYAQGKLAEMDAYSVALQTVPDQPGFPLTIDWPIAPTK